MQPANLNSNHWNCKDISKSQKIWQITIFGKAFNIRKKQVNLTFKEQLDIVLFVRNNLQDLNLLNKLG